MPENKKPQTGKAVDAEAAADACDMPAEAKTAKKRFDVDGFGLAAFGIAVVLGLLIGSVKIPLTSKGYDGSCFSLGMTGGPLIMALVLFSPLTKVSWL